MQSEQLGQSDPSDTTKASGCDKKDEAALEEVIPARKSSQERNSWRYFMTMNR